VNQLRPEDKISIVVYAGAAGVVLDSASGSEKDKVLQAIDNLQAGGCTAGGQGIQLAYEIAKKNLMKDGNNRVILATDGDFNIGVTNDGDLTRMIEEKRNDGIFLSIFGFGMGNYKDSKMEKIADKGNGTLAYIDNMLEAKKVFVSQLAGTLFTVAKDVKIQVEFNPAKVKAYRLIGYENRMLENKDFNDDKKDAGEIGAGHTVTALYEIVPAGSKEEFPGTDALKYQQVKVAPSDELLTVKLRYKEPDGDTSKLLTKILRPQDASAQPT
jgi:Ca-activated chloride channel family protein